MSKTPTGRRKKLTAAAVNDTVSDDSAGQAAVLKLKDLPGQSRSKKPSIHYQLVLPPVVNHSPVVNLDASATDSEAEMADSHAFRPVDFSGTAEADAKSWIQKVEIYADFSGYDAAKTLKMVKMLLTGAAAQWFEGLGADRKDTLANFKTAFKERFEASDLIKYQKASDLFNRKQKDTESVDNYITAMTEIARTLGADDKTLCWALKCGMRSQITAYLVQTKSETLAAICENARIAETTTKIAPATYPTELHTKMEQMQLQLGQILQKIDKGETRRVFTTTDSGPPSRSRTPERSGFSAATKRDFTPERERRYVSFQDNYGGPRAQDNVRPYQPSRFDSRNRQPPMRQVQPLMSNQYQTTERCQRCSRGPHDNPIRCHAINLTCFSCNKVGHVAAMCKSVRRQ